MLSRDFPTEVPPNFWTTQGAAASSEFPLRMDSEDGTPVGVDAPDKLGCIAVGMLLVGVADSFNRFCFARSDRDCSECCTEYW